MQVTWLSLPEVVCITSAGVSVSLTSACFIWYSCFGLCTWCCGCKIGWKDITWDKIAKGPPLESPSISFVMCRSAVFQHPITYTSIHTTICFCFHDANAFLTIHMYKNYAQHTSRKQHLNFSLPGPTYNHISWGQLVYEWKREFALAYKFQKILKLKT